jgi:DNA-binding LacI/PurR family transcriptional regulator
VRQDFGELGRRALHLLLDRIAGNGGTQPTLPIEPELVVRASAGPAGGRKPPR